MELVRSGIDEMKKMVTQTIKGMDSDVKMPSNLDSQFNGIEKDFEIKEPSELSSLESKELEVNEADLFNFDSLENMIDEYLPSLDSLSNLFPGMSELF